MNPFDQIGKSMVSLKRAANSGHFAINESGGRALLEAIGNMRQWVRTNGRQLDQLAQEPKLGMSHGANAMKPYMASVAAGDQGFIPMLKKFAESLDDAEQAIRTAMRNYGQLDEVSGGRF